MNSLYSSRTFVLELFKNILEQNGSKLFDTLIVLLKEFLKKLILKHISRRQQKHKKLPSMQRVKGLPASTLILSSTNINFWDIC